MGERGPVEVLGVRSRREGIAAEVTASGDVLLGPYEAPHSGWVATPFRLLPNEARQLRDVLCAWLGNPGT
jgi:hypothetical protein